MAYGVKYRLEYDNLKGKKFRVDFLVKDYSGGIEILTPSSNPYTITHNKDMGEDYLGGLVVTKYTVEAYSTPTFNAASFQSENYGDLLIAKYNANDLGVYILESYGIIVPFECQDLYEHDPFVVSVGAECGLSSLKTIAYFDTDNDKGYTGKSKLIEIIYRCLNQIPYPSQFSLRSINNTKVKVGTEIVNIDKDFFQLATDNEVFQLSIYDYDSCYNVLAQILGSNCELFFAQGFWWIRNIPEIGQGNSYATTYLPDGSFDYRSEYNRPARNVSYTSDLVPMKDGIIGKELSQKNVLISQKPGFLVNFIKNANFAEYVNLPFLYLIDWLDTYAVSGLPRIEDRLHGGAGTEENPFYFQINGSVYSPTFTGVDPQYIQSSSVPFYPFGRFLTGSYVEPENLLISGKVELGTRIKALRLQLIATNNTGTPYYLNNEDSWQETPVFYLKEVSASKRTGEFAIEIPTPPPPPGVVDFNVLYEYNFYVRIFRGEQIYENSGTPSATNTFFVKLYQINVNKRPSLFKEAIEGKDDLYVINRYSDRQSDKKIEIKLGTPNAPFAFGSFYETPESTVSITGFNFFGDLIIPGLPSGGYGFHQGEGYLRVMGERLPFFEAPLYGRLSFNELLSVQGQKFRAVNLSFNERRDEISVKAVKVDFNSSLVITSKYSKGIEDTANPLGVGNTTLLLDKGRASARGDNFTYDVDDLGNKFFKVNDNLRINTVVPRDNKVGIGDYDPDTSTEVYGKFGIKNTDEKLGSFDMSLLTDDRDYTFPDRDIVVNDWDYLDNKPTKYFEQNIPSNHWIIVHDFGKKALCQTFNPSGAQVFGDIQQVSNIELHVKFSKNETGYALLMGI